MSEGPRGIFVVFEGIDGSGKSLQSRRLGAWLETLGLDVVSTREPTDGVWGRRYRSWARGERQDPPEEVLRFFLEDRVEHVREVVLPALERGAVVVSDRYAASTIAYQAAQGLDRDALLERHRALDLPEPDLVLWIRVPVTLAVARIDADGAERFEDPAFLGRVDAEYARLEMVEIDGRGSPEEVADRVRGAVEPLLRARGLLSA